MEEILHQLIGSSSHFLCFFSTSQVVCRISSINSIITYTSPTPADPMKKGVVTKKDHQLEMGVNQTYGKTSKSSICP